MLIHHCHFGWTRVEYPQPQAVGEDEDRYGQPTCKRLSVILYKSKESVDNIGKAQFFPNDEFYSYAKGVAIKMMVP